MNKYLIIFVFSLLMAQPQESDGILEKIQKNTIIINKQKDNIHEKKFVRAKSLERAGLYEEAFLLFKAINQDKPGISKYFSPLKNYLKQNCGE